MATKTRKCCFCKTRQPAESMMILPAGAFCGIEHAIAYGRKRGQKALESRRRHESKEARAGLKSRSDWLREAQIAFNAYIRERDKGLPCVSCGRNTGCKMNAGHYRSVGSSPATRFEELNCWLQCEHCNSYLSGNQIEYRKELLRRIGAERLDWLEGPHEAKHYTVDDLKRIKAEYVAKLKALRSVSLPEQ